MQRINVIARKAGEDRRCAFMSEQQDLFLIFIYFLVADKETGLSRTNPRPHPERRSNSDNARYSARGGGGIMGQGCLGAYCNTAEGLLRVQMSTKVRQPTPESA